MGFNAFDPMPSIETFGVVRETGTIGSPVFASVVVPTLPKALRLAAFCAATCACKAWSDASDRCMESWARWP
jgi:hypothetical protein